jgi:precorrin-6B methylase 2
MIARPRQSLALLICLSLLSLTAGCQDRATTDATDASASTTADAAAAPAADPVQDAAPVTAATEPPSSVPASTDPAADQPAREPDVIYVPTPQPVVEAMLELAKVNKNDVLYDLGSGDGRIPITAAKKLGIRAVGIDINPVRIREANANAQKEGVTDLVTFKQEDLFETDFSEASVVTLYLLSSLNEKLRPRLQAELKPGTRIVSHAFLMGDWPPEKTVQVGNNTIYLWTVGGAKK